MRRSNRTLLILCATLLAMMAQAVAAQDAADPEAWDPKVEAGPRDLRKVGKYAEALEAYDALLKRRPARSNPADRARIALGRADCPRQHRRVGQGGRGPRRGGRRDCPKRHQSLKAPRPPRSSGVEVQFDRGDWDGAAASAAKDALEARRPTTSSAAGSEARLLDARGDQLGGRRQPASGSSTTRTSTPTTWRRTPPALLLIGQATERYARGQPPRRGPSADELNGVINNVYEVAIKADPMCWQAHWLEGKLFLAGYQEGDARKELMAAQKINPHSPEVLVTLGNADLQGYKLAAGPEEGRAGAGDQPEDTPPRTSSWPT